MPDALDSLENTAFSGKLPTDDAEALRAVLRAEVTPYDALKWIAGLPADRREAVLGLLNRDDLT